METRARKRVGILALAAFLTSTVGVAGCGGATGTTATTAAATASTTATTAAAATQGSVASASDSNWNSCRKAQANGSCPGRCHDYTDTNGDDICDLSQSDPNDSASAVSVAAGTTVDDDQTGDCPLGPCAICGICANLV